jgi:hypothetical protein
MRRHRRTVIRRRPADYQSGRALQQFRHSSSRTRALPGDECRARAVCVRIRGGW